MGKQDDKRMMSSTPAQVMEDTAGLMEEQDEETNGLHSSICKPCWLEPSRLRKLQTIIAGSIRAPHRLLHAGLIDSDKCTHSACNGARCDTEHISWYCKRWTRVRQPFVDALRNKLDWIEERSQCRHKMITDIIGNN